MVVLRANTTSVSLLKASLCDQKEPVFGAVLTPPARRTRSRAVSRCEWAASSDLSLQCFVIDNQDLSRPTTLLAERASISSRRNRHNSACRDVLKRSWFFITHLARSCRFELRAF